MCIFPRILQMFAPTLPHSSFTQAPYPATAGYPQRSSSRLEDLERMVAIQQQEAARLQALIHSERAALAQEQQIQRHIMHQHQMQALRSCNYPNTVYATPHLMQQSQQWPNAVHAFPPPYLPQQAPPSYLHASPFNVHGYPASQVAVPHCSHIHPGSHFSPRDAERNTVCERPQLDQFRSRSSERRRAAEMELTDRPRRSCSRGRAASPPTNASRFAAEVPLPSRRSMGGFSTRSSSAPHSPPRSRSQSRSKAATEVGGCTVDPESEECKKAREKQKKQNIIELEAAKQERKSETARRKKQAFNAEMTEYFRSKALKTPEVAYSRRFDSIKQWKDAYLEAKVAAGVEERRAASPPPQVISETQTSYSGATVDSLERMFDAPLSRQATRTPRSSRAFATASYDDSRRSQSLLQGLAPEDAARVVSRFGGVRGPFERFDDVSEQSSVVDTERSARVSSRGHSRVASPAPPVSSAPAAMIDRRAASPVSPTPRQEYTRVGHRLQGEDASHVQTRDLFSGMNLHASSTGDFDDDDGNEALRFPPLPRSSKNQQQQQRNLSDYTPSPTKLQQYLQAAKLQSPMHSSFGPAAATPPTLHRYATLV